MGGAAASIVPTAARSDTSPMSRPVDNLLPMLVERRLPISDLKIRVSSCRLRVLVIQNRTHQVQRRSLSHEPRSDRTSQIMESHIREPAVARTRTQAGRKFFRCCPLTFPQPSCGTRMRSIYDLWFLHERFLAFAWHFIYSSQSALTVPEAATASFAPCGSTLPATRPR